jgi:epsilon-lactone hydrolase
MAVTLRDKGIPLPGAILSVTPWYDMEMRDGTLKSNAETDALLHAVVGNVSRVLDRR